jgi:hypothetical protein
MPYAQPGHIVETRAYAAPPVRADQTEPVATHLEAAVNRARHQAEETYRLVAVAEQLIARVTGMGLEEQKTGMSPMPCGLLPQLDAHLEDQDKGLGTLNSIFDRLQRLI